MSTNEAVAGALVAGAPVTGAPVALPMPQADPFPVATPHSDSNEPALPEDVVSGMEDDDPPAYSASVYPSAAYHSLPVTSKGQAPVDYPAGMYPQEQMQPLLGAPSQHVVIVRLPPERIPTDEPIRAIVLSLFVTICCCCCIGIPALVYAGTVLTTRSSTRTPVALNKI